MKKIAILFLATLFTLGCKDDEFLDDVNPNPNAVDLEAAFSNENGVQSLLNGAYSALQLRGNMGGIFQNTAYLLSEAGRLGNFVPNNIPDIPALGSLSYNSSSEYGERIYLDIYRLIFRANVIIDGLEGNKEIDASMAQLFTAQAKFLKALGLFWATTTFNNGNVPMPSNAATSIVDAATGISARDDVYNEVIELLKQAEVVYRSGNQSIQSEISKFPKGRVSLGAINSLLGKVYLYNDQNDLAIQEFEKVISSGDYQLTADIGENFNEAGEFNEESIFEVGFVINVERENFGDGEPSEFNIDEFSNEATIRNVTHARSNGGWGWLYTSHFIANLYKNEVLNDASKAEQIQIFDADGEEVSGETYDRAFSKRMMASVAYENDRTKFYSKGVVATSNRKGDQGTFITVPSRAQQKKFLNWNLESEPRARSGINERVIRYADVLLMCAEAYLKDRGDGGIAKATEYINLVRDRAGLVPVETLFAGVDEAPIVTHMSDPFLNPDFDLEMNDAVAAFEIPEACSTPNGFLIDFNNDSDQSCDNITSDLMVANKISTDEELQNVLEAKKSYIEENLPEIFKLEAKPVNAQNLLEHLFDVERPAEFAFEGHGILWNDLKRRPGGPEARIRELAEIDYIALTPNIDTNISWHKVRDVAGNNHDLWLQDFKRDKLVGLDSGDDLIKSLYLYIPLRAIRENPSLEGPLLVK